MHRTWAPHETLLQHTGKSMVQSELVMFIWMLSVRFANEHEHYPRICRGKILPQKIEDFSIQALDWSQANQSSIPVLSGGFIASGLKTIHSSYSKFSQNELVSVCKAPCSHTHDNRLWNIKPEHWSAMLWRNGFECQDHSCLTDFSLIWFIYCLTCHVPANQLEAQPANYWAVPA